MLISLLCDIRGIAWLHRKALKSGTSEDWAKYRKCRNKVTALTQSAKQQYLSTLACNLSNDSRKFWRNFKHLSARQKIQGVPLMLMLSLLISISFPLLTKLLVICNFHPPLHSLIFLFWMCRLWH